MKLLPYLLIFTVFFFDYFGVELRIIPRAATWMPEMLSAVVSVMLVIHLSVSRRISIRPAYVLLFLILAVHILLGVFLNSVQPGSVFAGIRNYFKWIPFFFLPIVFQLSPADISKQLKLILFLGLLQMPVAFFQRFIQFSNVQTGDVVSGTLTGSGILSVFLVAAMGIVTAYYLRGKIKRSVFLPTMLVLFLPTTINETKATLVLIPLILFIVSLFALGKRLGMRRLVGLAAGVVGLLAAYTALYDYAKPTDQISIAQMTQEKGRLSYYLYRGGDRKVEKILEDEKSVGVIKIPDIEVTRDGLPRIDSILLPIQTLAQDFPRLWFGLGIGNTSDSFLGGFSGVYAERIGDVVSMTALSFLIWETGIGGVVIFLCFLFLLFNDARYLAANQEEAGALPAGWVGVVAIAAIILMYNNFFLANVLIYLFGYFSGYIVSERFRIERLNTSIGGVSQERTLQVTDLGQTKDHC